MKGEVLLDNANTEIYFHSCGPLKTPRRIDVGDVGGCVRTHGDPDRQYPFCCPQIVCQ